MYLKTQVIPGPYTFLKRFAPKTLYLYLLPLPFTSTFLTSNPRFGSVRFKPRSLNPGSGSYRFQFVPVPVRVFFWDVFCIDFFLYFLIELIEIYLPIPIICFSNEKMRPHSRNTAHVKYPYIKDFSNFSKISILGLLTIVFYTVFCQDFHCGNEEFVRRSK